MFASMFSERDQHWMQKALTLAQYAAKQQEVPVGAMLVTAEGVAIGEGWNQPIMQHDPTAHAEVIALRAAAKHLGNYRLVNTTLYVTLEPCLMCVGALVHARVKRLVFGAVDPKAGAVVSVLRVLDTGKWNHRVDYAGGLMAESCGEILSDFFRARRG
ncbi:MAG: hypothetical protein A3E83_03005 [Gammaproteobacteria bacterium RIFCSPHIGHO2_12_FULL_41_20]|nr:MAG: hypothetical protein A3E83_03005 [Gammaproteobacteria bacterium RIFCSPHIGHO2_12_FULL_41_20]